jgi:hypothetical protein
MFDLVSVNRGFGILKTGYSQRLTITVFGDDVGDMQCYAP